MDDDSRRQVKEALVQHMRRYPHASDTADGIRRWWLPAPLTAIALPVLDDVLDELVADGLMKRVPLPDGGLLYAADLTGSSPLGT